MCQLPGNLASRHEDVSKKKSHRVLLVSVLLSAVVLVGGAWFSWLERKQDRQGVESELQAIAQLKIDQIAAWRAERLADAEVMMGSVSLNEEIAAWIETHDPSREEKILKWFGVTSRAYRYDRIILVGAEGQVLLSSNDRLGRVSEEVAQAMVIARRQQKPVLTDLYLDPDTSAPRISVVSPVPTSAGAAVILESDPWQFLYPMIESWPVPRNSAETTLARRDGDQVLYLNELRHQKSPALNLRIPLTRVEHPSVMAVLGKEGVVIGKDYRGVEVLAYLSAVPDSPWFMVAKIDTQEAFAASRTQSAFILSLVLLFLAVIFISAGFIRQGIRKEDVLQQSEKEIRQLNAELEQKNHDLLEENRERTKATETAREFSERLKIATRTAHIGIWDWDIVNNKQIWDNTICDIYGVTSGSFDGGVEDWSDHLHPDDRDRVGNELQAAQRGECEYAPEFRIIRSDGSIHYIKANSQTFWDESGKPIRMVGTNIDITAGKQAEQALHESGVALQHKNAELERFLYTASHDLKSPVVTVRTFIGYLEKDVAAGDAGRIAKDITFIRAAADKMAKLLDDLLEMSRIGRVVGPPERVTFRQLVDDALAAVAGQIAERGVTVTVGDGAATVFGDRMRLAEVLQNLLDNACKFMGDQKAPRIEVGVETRGAEVVFFVRDNGVGIDPRFHSKAFNLFEKFESKTEGSGIGLALVKRIVELHGGRIWVESAGVGQGACFYFTLPGEVNQTTEGEKS